MQQPTILVVDDEHRLADLYATWIGEEYETLTAYDGRGAVETIDETVDIVLLDRHMPGLSGDEVLEHIRADGHDCWVVMVTAVDPGLDIVQMDIHDYLTKPVTQCQLMRLIESLRVKNRFDGSRREHDELTNKMATLDDELDFDDLSNTDEYQHLEDRLKTVSDELAAEAEEAEAKLSDLYSEE
ncbi:response regulator transcription factor [Haloarchaeobius amylolyticus]|uniref:response regulator transcription factor n=1 Tax=Haloarchaeobius amylolyticus TaxID=1198296 RepID=UPI00226EFAF7|nr:response regulator [Haloarchaeobius amylolyticus]